jgi:hypothetical protein
MLASLVDFCLFLDLGNSVFLVFLFVVVDGYYYLPKRVRLFVFL